MLPQNETSGGGGHASAGGVFPADIDHLNREVSQFLDLATQNGRKLQ
jgi:hypothetical protein